MIFVVRRYGGQKMGTARFQCYLQSAVSVLQKNLENSVLKTKQVLQFTDPKQARPRKQSFYKSNKFRRENTDDEARMDAQDYEHPQSQEQPQQRAPYFNQHQTSSTPRYSLSKIRSYMSRKPYQPYRGVPQAIRGARPSTQGVIQQSYQFARPWNINV